MAASLRATSETREAHSGCSSAAKRASLQVASASFSQMSSHQVGVTRLPNHWWASSWMAVSA